MLTARTNRLRRALVATLGALVALPVLLAAQPALATVEPDDAADAVTASVRIAAEGDLAPGEDLVLQVTVDNASAIDVPEAVATVALGDGPVRQESALTSWLAGDDDVSLRARRTVGWLATPGIAAGQRSSFELTVPSGNLGIRDAPSVWGVRLLALELDLGEGRQVQARSSITWLPEGIESQQRLAVIVPLTSGIETESGVLDQSELTALTNPGGRLRARLDSAIATGATVAVDPMVLASIRLLGASTPASAGDWLADLEAADLDSFVLGWADVDPVELLRADGAALRAPASLEGEIDAANFADAPEPDPSTSTAPPSAAPTSPAEEPDEEPVEGEVVLPDVAALTAWEPTLPEVAWPVGAVGLNELQGLVGAQTVLLDDRSLAQTPADTARIDASTATILERSSVSAAVARAASATTTAAWQSAMSRVRALLAIAARADTGTIIAAMPRDGADTPRFDETLRALNELPWSSPGTLTEALDEPAAEVEAAEVAVPERQASADRLVGASLGLDAIASTVEQPATLLGERRTALLGVLSSAWRDSESWNAAVEQELAAIAAVSGSISIIGDTINQLSSHSELPITVSSTLPQRATVYVTVTPSNPSLSIEDQRVELVVPANGQARAIVPVESVANGSVTLTVSIASATGDSVAAPAFLDLNVQAGWETAITGTFGVLVGLVFIGGIVRTILKRRRARSATAQGDEQSADVEADARG